MIIGSSGPIGLSLVLKSKKKKIEMSEKKISDPANDKTLYFREYKFGQWGLFVLGVAPPNVSIIGLGSLIERDYTFEA